MAIGSQFVFAAALLLAGWLMGRWAARYDVRSWITDFIWRFIFRQGWRQSDVNLREMKVGDAELQQQIKERADAFKADAARGGQTRALAKHGALFGVAWVVNQVAGLISLLALLLLAHAAYRYLG